MVEIVAIGTSEFVLGFQLAGIRKAIVVNNKDAQEQFKKLLIDPNVGIILTDDGTIAAVGEQLQQDIQKLAKPVVVTLSIADTAHDALRKMIQKSIGVDLW